MGLDESLSKKECKALLDKYYIQHTAWKTFQARLATAISNLGGSEFWSSTCGALCKHGLCAEGANLAKVEKVICLCLGNLEDNASMYQLSLLILLLERLGVHHEKCSVFDPCHSSQEADVLKHLGFTIMHENTEAKISVRQMTLFYMPHADYVLTDNLIGANCESMHLIAILGNNLAWVCNSDCTDTASAEEANHTTSRAPHVQKVLTLAEETHLQDTWTSKVRSQLATLAPRMSKALGDGTCDALDCTLSTFRPKVPWEDIDNPQESSFLKSAL